MNSAFNLEKYILGHVQDSHEWHLPFLPPIHLPQFLSLHGVMLILAAVVMVLIFCVFYNKKQRVPGRFTNMLEVLILYIRDEISVKYLGEEEGRRMTPYFLTLFFFILILNLLGAIPLFSTATANPNVTGALAFLTWCFMVFGTLARNGFKGFKDYLIHPGVPVPVLFILVPIEVFGIFVRAAALMIRLFANMLAGHMVILCMIGLVILMGWVALPSIVMAVGISVMEIFVAFLQAYIFTLLSAVFIGQMYHPSH